MKKGLTRKEFLQQLGILGAASAGAVTFLSSCGGNNKQPAEGSNNQQTPKSVDNKANQGDPCTDVSNLSEADLQNRKNLEYVGSSPYPDKRCDNCNFYIAPTGSEPCGTCQVVKGPINPKGHCTAWVANQKT